MYTAWKVFKYGVNSGPNAGKYGPEITLYFDTFHVVVLTHFMPLVLFRYPLKTLENLWFSDVFRGYQKRPGI